MPQEIKQKTPTKHRALTLNTDLYQHMLDAPDLSDDQRKEIIQALWLLVISFVDLDYQLHLDHSCGKPQDSTDAAPKRAKPVLNCSHPNSTKPFAVAANSPTAPRPEQEAS